MKMSNWLAVCRDDMNVLGRATGEYGEVVNKENWTPSKQSKVLPNGQIYCLDTGHPEYMKKITVREHQIAWVSI